MTLPLTTSINFPPSFLSPFLAGVDKKKQKKAKQTLESSSLASTLEKDLQKQGYKSVDVDKADAEVTVVEEAVPTLRSRQVITGVSMEQASAPAFQEAIENAVAKATGMTSDDVQVWETNKLTNRQSNYINEYDDNDDGNDFVLVPYHCRTL